MNVTVEYAAQVKKAAGIASEQLEIAENATVQEVVLQVAETRGQALADLILDGAGGIHPSILLFVGDDQVAWDPPVALRERDTLTILSPVSGG